MMRLRLTGRFESPACFSIFFNAYLFSRNSAQRMSLCLPAIIFHHNNKKRRKECCIIGSSFPNHPASFPNLWNSMVDGLIFIVSHLFWSTLVPSGRRQDKEEVNGGGKFSGRLMSVVISWKKWWEKVLCHSYNGFAFMARIVQGQLPNKQIYHVTTYLCHHQSTSRYQSQVNARKDIVYFNVHCNHTSVNTAKKGSL